MESLIVELTQFFGVSRSLAIVLMPCFMLLPIAACTIIFISIRLGFHAMHFDVLKADMQEAKKDAKESRELCWRILNRMVDDIESKSNP